MIEITEDRYKKLERDSRKLEALKNYGVDKWIFYETALNDILIEEEIEKLCEDFVGYVQELLCEHGEADYPSVREAGLRISLNEEGEKSLMSSLDSFLLEYREITGYK